MIPAATGDNIGPGSYALKSFTDRFRPHSALAKKRGTMGVQKRFFSPTEFTGSPTGPNYESPGLNDPYAFKKYAIVGRRTGKKPLLTGTDDNVGPGTYDLPPVFGLRPRTAASSAPGSPRPGGSPRNAV